MLNEIRGEIRFINYFLDSDFLVVLAGDFLTALVVSFLAAGFSSGVVFLASSISFGASSLTLALRAPIALVLIDLIGSLSLAAKYSLDLRPL